MPFTIHFLLFCLFSGWTAIINDNLIANAFSVFALALGIVSGLLGAGVISQIYIIGGLSLSTEVIIAGGVGGLAIGWIVANMMVSCLDSGVSMVFVCFAEDDSALRVNHWEVYDKLAGSWERFNPGTLRWTNATLETGNPLAQARVIDNSYPIHTTTTAYQAKSSTVPPPMNPYYSSHNNTSHSNW